MNKMGKVKRGWHNPSKYLEAPKEGKCPYCNKRVKSLKNGLKAMFDMVEPIEEQQLAAKITS